MRIGLEHRVTIIRVSLLVVLAAAAAVVAVWLGAKPAEASYPGGNGRIAFASSRDGDREIYTMRTDGSDVRQLTNNDSGDYDPSFSADGAKIAFASSRDGNDAIYIMNSNGTGQTRITTGSTSNYSPIFSPSGEKIVFVRGRTGDIYIINKDGTNERNLTDQAGTDYQPTFSPDGSKIAFVTTRDLNQDIYSMNPDGTDQQRLTTGRNDFYNNPSYSPDGREIVFSVHRRGIAWPPDIYVMNADGTGERSVTHNTSTEGEPTFSPDGLKIAFTSSGSFGDEIYTVDVDGSNRQRLTTNEVYEGSPDWQPLPVFTILPPIFYIDFIKPTITDLRPTAGSALRDRTPAIQATVSDNYTNLAKTNIKLFVDGNRKTTFSYNSDTDRLSYTTGRLDNRLHTVRIVATDSSGNVSDKVWGFTVDAAKPVIKNVRPAPGSSTRDRTPAIRATVQDSQTNLAKGNVRLFVDGRRKTNFSYNRTTNRLSYASGRLGYGRHSVRIVARDQAGNAGIKSWRFRVVR